MLRSIGAKRMIMTIFKTLPRVDISHGPTPLEAMPRLSALLGCDLFIKRDDCTGLAGGGNKTRKLEYLIAAAQQAGADTLVTIGGIQSNHARQTAAAAAKFGFGCDLILEDVAGSPTENYDDNGNILLDKLLGANIHRLPHETDCDQFTGALMAKLRAQGKQPYLIPMGGSSVTGSMGYVRCALELVEQLNQRQLDIDLIVLATGSAGTQAGLLAGLLLAQRDIKVQGICVSRSGADQVQLVSSLLAQTLIHLGLDPSLGNDRVFADGDYVGQGYGIVTPSMIEAVQLTAQTEGIILDPVYTGKGMAGLIAGARQEKYSGKKVLFLHTGGSQGLFAYQQAFK